MRYAARGLLLVGALCLLLTVVVMTLAFMAAGQAPSASELTGDIGHALTYTLIGLPCLLAGTILWLLSLIGRCCQRCCKPNVAESVP